MTFFCIYISFTFHIIELNYTIKITNSTDLNQFGNTIKKPTQHFPSKSKK